MLLRVFTALWCRWVTIADYVNLHAPGAGKKPKQVTKIVKSLQQSGTMGVLAWCCVEHLTLCSVPQTTS